MFFLLKTLAYLKVFVYLCNVVPTTLYTEKQTKFSLLWTKVKF